LTVCAVVFLACVVLGCMSISLGIGTGHSDSGLLEQEGELDVKDGLTQTVFYPIPYASPPNLVVNDSFHSVVVEEQACDHFRFRGVKAEPSVGWKAKGLRGPPPAPPAPIIVTPAATSSESAKP
jgi:hypothetical protein